MAEGVPVDTLVERCLHEARERRIDRLVEALESIDQLGPKHAPKAQKGADTNTMLAYEDGNADAAFDAAVIARAALENWTAG